ncbi:unnamed protein product [Closterium sp. Naga37s-1]|nr:unnamed protein product [Closterium sp. Naga37s-1]
MLKDKRAAFLRQQERVQARTVVDHAAATAARRQAAPSPAAVAPASTAVAGEVAGSGKGIAVGFQGLQAENWLADAGKYEAVLRVRQLPLGQKIKKVIDLLFRVSAPPRLPLLPLLPLPPRPPPPSPPSPRSSLHALLPPRSILLTPPHAERQGLTAEQVEAVTMVDVTTSRELQASLRANPKVAVHGNTYIYKAKHELAGRDDLLRLIREHKDGIPMGDVRDSYSGVAAHVQELRALGQAWVLFNADSGDEVLFPNDPRIAIKVDPDIRALFRRIDLPRDLTDLEKELQRCGQNPAMPAVRRLQALEGAMTAQTQKPKAKRKRESKRTKYTNNHLPELFASTPM